MKGYIYGGLVGLFFWIILIGGSISIASLIKGACL